ncbi:MAG: transcriptional regulator [Candidatus Bathyarchaeaceae archaeon]
MLLPCEVAVRSLVPAIRSAIARELTQTYGLRQKDVANLLGVTQTAVSKYTRHVRGVILKIEEVEEIQPTLKEVVISLVNGRMSKYELVAKFCVACEIIRQKGLMCELCKLSDPSIEVQQCFVCHSDTHTRQKSKSEG